ncbi:MAG: S41 family peptidase [Acidobacteriota bacterium]
MEIGRQRLLVVSLSLLVVVFALAGRLVGDDGQREETYDQLATFSEVLHLVDTSYVDAVSEDELTVGAFRGMLSSLDPKSGWLSAEAVQEYLDSGADRISSGLETTKRGGYAYVVAVQKGSPAEKAGVGPGDYIRSVDGQSTREMSVFEVRQRLHGAPSTMIHLNLFGNGQGRDVVIDLEPFQSPPVTVSTHEGGVLLLRVNYLEDRTVDRLRELLSHPKQGTEKVLLDLRDTVGGGRAEGAALADLFLGSGTIVRIRQRGQEETSLEAHETVVWSGPLAVLVNGLSAGAVEIAVSALQENHRAEILGEPTFGDASLQQLIRLPDQSAIILTVGKYLTAAAESWAGEGVQPDVAISSRPDGGPATALGEDAADEAGASPADGTRKETADRQLQEALDHLAHGQADLTRKKTAA